MIDHVTEISSTQLVAETQQRCYNGYRFVTATCVDNGNETFDLLYHFDLDGQLDHLRLNVRKDEDVPSVSQIYFCALLVENEIKELFGVNITDIIIDYGGRMLLAEGAPTTPMAGGQIIIERR
jgi:NADH:ubiquinone oxidoreductase subunit C